MKNTLLASFWFLLTGISSLNAQVTFLGVKGGLSIPDLSNGNTVQTQGFKSRTAPAFGLLAYRNLSEKLSLQIELSYVGQGGKKQGLQVLDPSMLSGIPVPTGVNLYANFKNVAILNYLEVPILAKYSHRIFRTHLLYIDAGPNIGFLLSAKEKTSGMSQLFVDPNGTLLTIEGQPVPAQSFKSETNVRNDLKKINFGITGGVGISKKYGPGDLIFDIRGSYGFINIQKDPSNGKNNTGSLIFSLGYALPI